MKDEKEPLEQKQNSEEEEYSFLQEVIKDEVGGTGKRKKRKGEPGYSRLDLSG